MYAQNLSGGMSSSVSADTEKTRRKNAIQREIIMKDSDYRRSISEKIQIESELKRLRNDEARVRMSLQERQTRLTKLEQDIAHSDEDLRELRKKLNLL